MSQDHFGDAAKVIGANAAAISISLTGIETIVSILAGLAALAYTLMKIADWLRERQERLKRNSDEIS